MNGSRFLGIITALFEHLCVENDNTRPVIDGEHYHPDKTTDTIIHGCQVKNIMYYAIVIDNSLLSRLPIDGIKSFIVEAKLIRIKYE